MYLNWCIPQQTRVYRYNERQQNLNIKFLLAVYYSRSQIHFHWIWSSSFIYSNLIFFHHVKFLLFIPLQNVFLPCYVYHNLCHLFKLQVNCVFALETKNERKKMFKKCFALDYAEKNFKENCFECKMRCLYVTSDDESFTHILYFVFCW